MWYTDLLGVLTCRSKVRHSYRQMNTFVAEQIY